ncbi:restriction endonuclease subunit S [Lentibacillus salicampi]|uniref:Restriction endonuclease subunit S n=1 Tax=Lentibacillus salicampi TaxID=175306 RepID=A0A4Y9AB06_9BACI|nr:restriction endonuclease subunit S [Lentibacillus salicampi]TFJ93099.1 restriction endonuclease subunit S [Lentibacillus salicampi]
MKNKQIPEIRLLGFTGKWEQRKLGEVFEQTSNHLNPKEENLELWSLTVENGLTPKTDRYNREFLVKKEDQFKSVSNNEFIYNPMNMTLGAVDLNLTGKKVAVSGYYITMKSKNGFDSKFFSVWLKSSSAIKMYKTYATGSLIERQRVQFSTLSQIKALVPSEEEQIQIGDFFKKLDDTITIQQRELDILKQTKQGFLQKMFPKEGESVPEIRFPGFTGDWEQRKLGDMSNGFEYGLSASATEYDGKNKYIRITDIDDDTREFLKDNLTSPNIDLPAVENYLVKEGDILFARTGASVGKSYIYNKKDGKVYYAGFLIRARIRPEYDPEFIFQNTLTSKYSKFIKITSQRSGQPGVNAKEYANFTMMVPTYDEQAKIGNFFKHLDETIALHQRGLEALQETKNAFLQKMFV